MIYQQTDTFHQSSLLVDYIILNWIYGQYEEIINGLMIIVNSDPLQSTPEYAICIPYIVQIDDRDACMYHLLIGIT